MGNMLKPDMPGPTADEIALQKAQKEALKKETEDKAKAEEEERKRQRELKQGRVGLRSLLSGGFGGFKLGG